MTPQNQFKKQTGFTLAELMLAAVLAAIVILAVGVVIVEGHRGWQAMYSRISVGVVGDSYVARNAFDSVIRRASMERILVDKDGEWIEVYYPSDPNSPTVDRYARFYCSDAGQLLIEHGQSEPRSKLTTQTICSNVADCTFKRFGRSVQMILTLDQGDKSIVVASSAFAHNQ